MPSTTDILFHKYIGIPYQLFVSYDNHNDASVNVIFLHGIGSSAKMWEKKTLLHKIHPKARLITVDLLGFGNSPKPEWSKYNASEQATALAKTLRKKNIQGKVIIVGHSLGALVSIEYARKYPKRVSRLILCSPPFYQPPKKIKNGRFIPRDDAYRKIYEAVRKRPETFLKITNALSMYYKTFNKGFNVDENVLPAYIKSLEASIENQNSIKDAVKLTQPVDILYGVLDPLLIKRNIQYVATKKQNTVVHEVLAAHEIMGVYSTKLVMLLHEHIATYLKEDQPK